MVGKGFAELKTVAVECGIKPAQRLRTIAKAEVYDVGKREDFDFANFHPKRLERFHALGDERDGFLQIVTVRPRGKNRHVSVGLAFRGQFHTQAVEKGGKGIGDIADQSKMAQRRFLPLV